MKFIKGIPFFALILGLVLAGAPMPVAAQDDDSNANSSSGSVILPSSELQQLVAPIALYSDPLLALILPASTFPQEVVQANQYVAAGHTDFASQDWDASVKGLAHYPDVLQMMAGNLDWTNQLGAAVLAQQADVMAAIQAQRAKAKSLGNLVSTPQQTVETADDAIQIVPTDPQTVYVPSYDPALVYTDPPPVGGAFVTFGAGFALGIWAGGGFDWGGGVILNGGFWSGGGWSWSSWSSYHYHSSYWSHYSWHRSAHDHWSRPHPHYHGHHGEHPPDWHHHEHFLHGETWHHHGEVPEPHAHEFDRHHPNPRENHYEHHEERHHEEHRERHHEEHREHHREHHEEHHGGGRHRR